METMLQQLHEVPGVMGGMLVDAEGGVMARTLDKIYPDEMLLRAASVLADSSVGLASTAGDLELLDFRYGDGRLVVRPSERGSIMVLCRKNVNLHLLLINLKVVEKKLAKTPTVAAGEKVSPPVTTKGPQPAAGGKGIMLGAEIMKTTANTYWTQMGNLVALNRSTALALSTAYQTGTFKKIKLTNMKNGRSKTFPVMVITDDVDHHFDNRAALTLATAESLDVVQGEMIRAELLVGTGLFGWEGI
jgi:predicted regulator of Ras-like GTPase activity (Roadblock/LC7/MglB family)